MCFEQSAGRRNGSRASDKQLHDFQLVRQLYYRTSARGQQYNCRPNPPPDSGKLFVFTPSDMNTQRLSYGYDGCEHFLLDGKYLWASSREKGWRYDPEAETWAEVLARPQALENGTLWGDTRVDKELGWRPCTIDRQTLEVHPIMIAPGEQYADTRHSTFRYRGTRRGRPSFGSYDYYEEDGTLRYSNDPSHPTIEIPQLRGLVGGRYYRKEDGTLVGSVLVGTQFSEQGAGKHIVVLPSGAAVFGFGSGFHLVATDDTVNTVSGVVTGSALPADSAYAIAFDETGNGWIPTSGGVAVVNESGLVHTHFTMADGLPAVPTLGVALAGNDVFFCSAQGDDDGCLIHYDPATAVFTRFGQADGLATNSIASIAPTSEGKLRIEYEPNYQRGGEHSGKYRVFPVGEFDPILQSVSSGGPDHLVERSEIENAKSGRDLPVLGGHVQGETEHKGRKYLCGTHGVVIMDISKASEVLSVASMIAPELVLTPEEQLRCSAKNVEMHIDSDADLLRYLEDDNPFVRARALAWARDTTRRVPPDVLTSPISDSNAQVRRDAYCLLKFCEDDEQVAAILQPRLGDPDRELRQAIIIELARRGHPPEVECLEEIFTLAEKERENGYIASSAVVTT